MKQPTRKHKDTTDNIKRLELKNHKFSLSRQDSHFTSSVSVYPDNSEPAAGNVTVCQTQQFTPAMLFGTRFQHFMPFIVVTVSQLLSASFWKDSLSRVPKKKPGCCCVCTFRHIQEVLEFKLPVNSILKMEVAFWTEGWSQCGGNLNMQLARLDRGRWKNKNEICAESPQTCIFCTLLKQRKLHTNKTTFKTWAVAIIRTSVQVSG